MNTIKGFTNVVLRRIGREIPLHAVFLNLDDCEPKSRVEVVGNRDQRSDTGYLILYPLRCHRPLIRNDLIKSTPEPQLKKIVQI